MYLHIGNEISIPLKEIIAILDLTKMDLAVPTQELIDLAHGENRVIASIENCQPKSCIITDQLLYLSTISAITLYHRAKNMEMVIRERRYA